MQTPMGDPRPLARVHFDAVRAMRVHDDSKGRGHGMAATIEDRPTASPGAPAAAAYYIGIDPGTHCGWAVLDPQGGRVASGTWNLSPKRHEGGGMRFVRLERYVAELLDTYPGAHVAYEEVRRHMGTDAAHIYGGIVATIARLCEVHALPYTGIPVGTIKKLATGKGNAIKVAMMEAAESRWFWPVANDNEADALWVADALREGN
jgi:crossover junction endodeoxyribonuclease RuvC